MLTLITGTPGAGKSLYAVSELARKVPGSIIEQNGVSVPRRLLSNIRGLVVEHEVIDAEWLNQWHVHAKPGDVILFDEVQEVWRPRALGKDVPPAIAALETHRHMGVDLILVTQHPMLLDANIRRLVNQHIHVRRMLSGMSWLYEWDHCSNVSTYKTAIHSRMWRYPKDAFKLYKSAQLHTKPTTRIPAVAYVGLVAFAGAVYMGKGQFEKFSARLNGETGLEVAPAKLPPPDMAAFFAEEDKAADHRGPVGPQSAAPSFAQVIAPHFVYMGCIANANECRCYDEAGLRVLLDDATCRASIGASIRLAAGGSNRSLSSRPVPPSNESAADGGKAAAPGGPDASLSTGEVLEPKPAGPVL